LKEILKFFIYNVVVLSSMVMALGNLSLGGYVFGQRSLKQFGKFVQYINRRLSMVILPLVIVALV